MALVIQSLLVELLEVISLELEPDELARFLATCQYFYALRERLWKHYWRNTVQECKGCQWRGKGLDINDAIVVCFDPHDECRLWCMWPKPMARRIHWVYHSVDCFESDCCRTSVDIWNGSLIRLDKREAEYRNNKYWQGCTHSIAWPAWPARSVDYRPLEHSW